MPAQTITVEQQSLIDAAKASVLAYNDKDWNKARATLAPNFVYDEVATRRRIQGADAAIAVWQGWAQAFPDSQATIHDGLASGDTVVLEMTWTGTHRGPLQTARGTIAATGRPIEIRACMVMEMLGDKVALQRHYFDMATLLDQLGATA